MTMALAKVVRMKVRALSDGFYGGFRRRAGSVFEFKGDADSLGKWMVAVESSTPPKTSKNKPAPATFSDLTRADGSNLMPVV